MSKQLEPTLKEQRDELRRLIHIQLTVLTYETMTKQEKEALLPGLKKLIRKLESKTLEVGCM